MINFIDVSLYNIALPSNLVTIGHDAFYNCTNLQSIIIPNSVTTIDHLAFSHCSNLRSVTLSNQLVKIDKQTFENCAALESIYIPASVHYIDCYSSYTQWLDDLFQAYSLIPCLTMCSSIIPLGMKRRRVLVMVLSMD